MKKLSLSFVFITLFVQCSIAQFFQTQYFDGADTSDNAILIEIVPEESNIWQIGKPQKSIFDSAATSPNVIVTDTVIFYPENDTSSFTAKILMHGQNWGIFALQWKQKLNMDTSRDGGIIEYSLDSGNTWINVFNNPKVYNFYGYDSSNVDTLPGGEFAFSGTDSSWKDIWLCFDISWLQQFEWNDTLLFRFTFLSDSINTNKEGWMIDNMLAHITFLHTIKETEQEGYIKVYPNPANNIVHIQADKIMDYHIIEQMELVDQVGRVIDKWTNIPTKFWFTTDTYPDGLYNLMVKTNVKSETIPLIISNHR